ncbi:MAG: undecaprenyl-diphosphate phosphatase [Saprospiraceae bacterium]|jgi:undecaprenyl-diphosphatase|nr:undecaprenyl-diphosphate phosphatase [Saprospiraceae bacterium]
MNLEVLQAIVLGLIQGLTEFLPVSSSGHLEIAKFILGNEAVPHESLLMTVVLHFGTALATLYVFRKDVVQILTGFFWGPSNPHRTFGWQIILSMLPAAFVGLFFEDEIDQMFSQNILFVCSMLMLTGVLLFIAEKASYTGKGITFSSALWVGIAQAIAITPGISRSGATISASVLLGIDRASAARFSFLMVVPLIFGKMTKDLMDGSFQLQSTAMMPLLTGFIVSFFVGIFACKWMIALVQKSKLHYFSLYCLVAGFVGILYAVGK